MKHSTEIIIIELGMLGLALFMWWSLASEVESGKPFELNNKWYQATQVERTK